MAVFLELSQGDTLLVGKSTRIRLERKTGQRARLAIDSNEDVDRVKAGDPVPPLTATAVPQAMRRMAALPSTEAKQPFLQRRVAQQT